ncbi:hypothetical protein [Methylocella silvestris]|uniref:Uncharacterized protein n=1 Tax=Methylocella silvestris TaxID=199596 RepID=A0A2J7TG32_METSI|nr:hypothetical protein [Methylocella silvestris]PNG25709.1 hypothetical protein CR492_12390 [Methylocella silvestris]
MNIPGVDPILSSIQEDVVALCDSMFSYDVENGVDRRATCQQAVIRSVEARAKDTFRAAGLPRQQRKRMVQEITDTARKTFDRRWAELIAAQKQGNA